MAIGMFGMDVPRKRTQTPTPSQPVPAQNVSTETASQGSFVSEKVSSFSKFQDQFINRDVQRTNRYRVFIDSPSGTSERINFLCESIQFPGQNMRTSTDDLRDGPVREIVHGTTYGPINLTFICTTGMPEKQWFENWQTYIINRDSGRKTWQVKYYRDYVKNIELYTLDKNDEDGYKVTIYEAFPKTITQQEFSNTSADSYQTISVEFAYRYWDSESLGPPTSTTEKTLPITQLPDTYGSKPQTIDEKVAGGSPWLNPNTNEYLPTPAQPVPNDPSDQILNNRN